MCETKIKKSLIFSFFVTLALATSFLFTIISERPSFAAVCKTAPTTYKLSDDGNQITQTFNGQIEVNPGTSFSSCSAAPAPKVYTQQGDTLVYSNKINDNCGNTITLSKAPTAGSNIAGRYQPFTNNCTPTVGAANVTVATTNTFDPTASTTDDSGSTSRTGCSIDGIGWLLCPVIDFASNIADAALGFLSTTFLETNTNLYDTKSATYSAWQWILGFANIIFVVIFLIIIFSQATGFGISNYGIKKMLPKLIIGVILINLSFFICSVLVDLSNLAGYGFNKFFDSLANGVQNANQDDPLARGNVFGGIAGLIVTGAVAGVAIYAILAFFAPVLIAAIVGLLMIFLFLVARQALIVLGIIIAPLAFAAWLLPNTEKLFKRWWSIFIQLLLLFPIIGIVYGGSKLVSKVLASAYSGENGGNLSNGLQTASSVTGNGGNVVGQIIAAAVLVVPLFAVPFLLKGAISGIPVVGKLASRAYNGATGSARNRTKNMTDPMFAGLRAQQRAGVRGWMGRSRVQRDEHGNPVFNEKGQMIGKNGQPVRRTASQLINETKRSFEDNAKSYDKLGDALYENRAFNSPGSLAGKSERRNERTGVISERTKAGYHAELAEEKTTDETLRSMDQQSLALAQATRIAETKRLGDFSRDLHGDPTLLNVAAGNVDADRGRRIAESFATQAIRKARDENTQAAMISINERIRRRDPILKSDGTQEFNDKGEPQYYTLDRAFADAAQAGDTDSLKAAATLYMRQGTGGTEKLRTAIKDNEDQFDRTDLEHANMSQEFRGYLSDEHAKDLKVKNRDVLQWVYNANPTVSASGERVAAPRLETMSKETATYKLSPKEMSTQAGESLARARQQAKDTGGQYGLNNAMAQSILLEDGIVQDMPQESIRQVVAAVSNQQTAQIVMNADTFVRFDDDVKRHINALAKGEASEFNPKMDNKDSGQSPPETFGFDFSETGGGRDE